MTNFDKMLILDGAAGPGQWSSLVFVVRPNSFIGSAAHNVKIIKVNKR